MGPKFGWERSPITDYRLLDRSRSSDIVGSCVIWYTRRQVLSEVARFPDGARGWVLRVTL